METDSRYANYLGRDPYPVRQPAGSVQQLNLKPVSAVNTTTGTEITTNIEQVPANKTPEKSDNVRKEVNIYENVTVNSGGNTPSYCSLSSLNDAKQKLPATQTTEQKEAVETQTKENGASTGTLETTKEGLMQWVKENVHKSEWKEYAAVAVGTLIIRKIFS